MTRRFPAPKCPCCQRINCRYPAWRLLRLKSSSSPAARTSCLYRRATIKTNGSRTIRSKSGKVERQLEGVCLQHTLSSSVGISRHLLHIHQLGECFRAVDDIHLERLQLEMPDRRCRELVMGLSHRRSSLILSMHPPSSRQHDSLVEDFGLLHAV